MLKKLINIFNAKSDPAEGVSELPLHIYKERTPVKSQEFKQLLNQHFKPLIENIGFKGSDFKYYRTNGVYTEIVLFWVYRGGGAVSVDLFIKSNEVSYPPEFKKFNPKKYDVNNCEFWQKLSPKHGESPWFWIFNKSEEINIEIINNIWNLFSTTGISYFNKFKDYKKYIEGIDEAEINKMAKSPFYLVNGYREIRIIYFLAAYWKSQEDWSKAKEYSKIGLSMVPEKDAEYTKIFEEIINS